MSFSSLTAAAQSVRLKAGLWIVFMVSIGACVQAQSKKVAANQGKVYTSVSQAADFPGGANKFYAYLGANIHYPEAAKKANVQGKVFVSYIVEMDGEISDVHITRGIGSGCDEEAIRVIEGMPKWVPAKQDGAGVRQELTVPINFTLNKEKAAPAVPEKKVIAKDGTVSTVPANADDIYSAVEQPAEFPGDKNAIYKYLATNIHYPEAARKARVQGRVFVTFVIEKDGSLSNVKAMHGPGSGLDEEAVRVMKASPKWNPGKQGGVVVRQQCTLPISFTLADK